MILVPRDKIDDYVASGWWGEETIGALLLATARRQPDAPAVADPPNAAQVSGRPARAWTWGRLLREVGRMAAFLHAQGLRKDDVLVAQLPNGVDQHALYLACACTGIVVTPVPVQYRGHELAHVVGSTGARVAITTERVGQHPIAQAWADHFGGTLQVWSFGHSLPAGVHALDAALEGCVPWTAEAIEAHMAAIGLTAHDVLTICWTSGTEARPKGVPRNHNEWLIVGQSVIDAGQLQPGARMVIPFPFVNMAGISTSLAAWLMLGGELRHHHPFDLGVFIAQLRDQPTDYTVAAPAVLAMLLKQPEQLDGVDLGRLKRIGSGGGPLADWLVEQFADKFGIEVVNYFGSNEGATMSSPLSRSTRRVRIFFALDSDHSKPGTPRRGKYSVRWRRSGMS